MVFKTFKAVTICLIKTEAGYSCVGRNNLSMLGLWEIQSFKEIVVN